MPNFHCLHPSPDHHQQTDRLLPLKTSPNTTPFWLFLIIHRRCVAPGREGGGGDEKPETPGFIVTSVSQLWSIRDTLARFTIPRAIPFRSSTPPTALDPPLAPHPPAHLCYNQRAFISDELFRIHFRGLSFISRPTELSCVAAGGEGGRGRAGGRGGRGTNSRLVGVTTAVGTLKGVHCQRIPTPPPAVCVGWMHPRDC